MQIEIKIMQTFMSQMIVDNVELVEGKSEVQEVEDENYTVLWAVNLR